MSITRHHNDWLRLVPNSGPFLSLPVLAQTFPQGLDAHDAEHARRLRLAFDEWDDNQLGGSGPRFSDHGEAVLRGCLQMDNWCLAMRRDIRWIMRM